VEKETFPKAPLPAGGGYGLKAPDKEGKWEVETYAWLPGSITVYQGDEVTLQGAIVKFCVRLVDQAAAC